MKRKKSNGPKSRVGNGKHQAWFYLRVSRQRKRNQMAKGIPPKESQMSTTPARFTKRSSSIRSSVPS